MEGWRSLFEDGAHKRENARWKSGDYLMASCSLGEYHMVRYEGMPTDFFFPSLEWLTKWLS